MTDYGIKVSKEGFDISGTTPTNFIMNSNWATIKVLQDGLGTITVGGTTSAYGTVTHNSGFYPLVLLFSELTPSSGRWYVAPFGSVSSENTYISSNFEANNSVGTSTFIFKIVNNTASSKNVKYHYYVIGETGK